MTTRELRDRVRVTKCGYGQYEVRIKYRGKEYRCQSNNSTAYDSLPSGRGMWINGYEEDPDAPMTGKQALQSFYDECKRKSNLM